MIKFKLNLNPVHKKKIFCQAQPMHLKKESLKQCVRTKFANGQEKATGSQVKLHERAIT